MIIYRAMTRCESTPALIDRLIASAPHCHTHDAVVEFLIDAGELESGLADALPDIPPSTSDRLRGISLRAGSAVIESWRGCHRAARAHVHEAARGLMLLRRHILPRQITIAAPEGYTHYGVFPEAYADAALRLLDHIQPSSVVTIGIRSIGTSLSAVVSAAAASRGCRVASVTVRPHGHPYDRHTELPQFFVERLATFEAPYFAIVDEGPGRSGSSFASVVDALKTIGVPAAQIVLFPSWNSDGSQLLNAHARDTWRQHARYPADFDRTFIESGRLGRDLSDLSAGRWRHFAARTDAPVVPQHERRKFAREGDRSTSLLKFAGLGRYGRNKLARARTLASERFTPPVESITHGFLQQQWLADPPVAGSTVGHEEIDTFARYLSFIAQEFVTGDRVPPADTIEMITANLDHAVDADTCNRLTNWLVARADVLDAPPARIDGRMLPAEWLRTRDGLIKTDALDHHADHFFPGCQNIAWDVAGTCIEFNLDEHRARRLITQTSILAADAHLGERIPVFRLAYLAFRFGYATTAATLVGEDDRRRFSSMARRYRDLLAALPDAA